MPSSACHKKITAVSESGSGQPCVLSAGHTVYCTYPSLANAASKTFTVTYVVASSVAPAPLSFPTRRSSDLGNNIAQDSTTITRNVTLTVAKDFADASVDAGTGGHTFTKIGRAHV